MNLGVFTYNFPHKKTQEGLFRLLMGGYQPRCILAADPVQLNFYQSKIRVAPKGLEYVHPRVIAEKLGIPYHVGAHNSPHSRDLIRDYDLDLGVILGARIIAEDIINAFRGGILNLHPGLLPQNRGLDNIKWAVLNRMRQGASAHLIERKIDKGNLICKRDVDVFQDDSLVDILLRVQSMELTLMGEALGTLESGQRIFPAVLDGHYFNAVPAELEATFFEKFAQYKSDYPTLPRDEGIEGRFGGA